MPADFSGTSPSILTKNPLIENTDVYNRDSFRLMILPCVTLAIIFHKAMVKFNASNKLNYTGLN